jgi:hypothetical protein
MNMLVRDYAGMSASDFLLDASFWRPQRLMPSAWLGHAPFAFWLMSVLKPRSVVELGVHTGFSYLSFCQAVRALDLDCTCSGIDTWLGDEHAGFYGDEVYCELAAANAENASFSRLVRSTFQDALSQIDDDSVDLLHIDGRHHYADVREDFESWIPKLSSRAIVLFHDTSVPRFGVGKLWDELCEEHPHFTFHHSHGLGVLGYGKNIPLKLKQLFWLANIPAMSESVRNAYERLGDAIANQQKVAELEQQLHSQRASTSWKITAPLRALSRGSRIVGRLTAAFRV